MICIRCKKEVFPGDRPDGLPYGLGVIINDRVIAICMDCILETRTMDEKSRKWFLKQINDASEQDDDEVIKI